MLGKRPSRIAVSAAAYDERNTSGLNRYTHEVLGALLKLEPDLIAYATSSALIAEYGDSVRRVPIRLLSESNFRGNLSRLAWHQTALPMLLRRADASMFYSTVPEGMIAPPCPQVITIHDLLPLHFPETYPRLSYYFRYVLPHVVRASAAIVVTSQATERDVRRFFRVYDKPVHVVYQGFKQETFHLQTTETADTARRRYGLGEFVLSVGETRPYKNIRRLIEAFARLDAPGLQLAIVGKTNKMDKEVLELPRRLGVAGHVRFLGCVPDQDLAALYGAARVFIFPSLYEGFGIPPLEAMACGCPVVASHAASIPEVCGDVAVYVDPLSVDSIAQGIAQVVNDRSVSEELRRRGLDRVTRFSYTNAAKQLLDIFRGVSPRAVRRSGEPV